MAHSPLPDEQPDRADEGHDADEGGEVADGGGAVEHAHVLAGGRVPRPPLGRDRAEHDDAEQLERRGAFN